MNIPLVKKWIAAMRSGEYRFAQGDYETLDGAFCAVGVATKIFPEINDEDSAEIVFDLPTGAGMRITHINDGRTTTDFEPVCQYLESMIARQEDTQ